MSDPQHPVDVTPPVIAVVTEPAAAVTVRSLVSQDYPALVDIVVAPPAARTSPVPDARSPVEIDRKPTSHFVLFVRGGVALQRDALRRLVDDAVSTGAAAVGPKLVGTEPARQLVDVGGSVDRLGGYRPVALDGEVDQGQHDTARDCFVAPTAAILVRTDVYRHIGGYDRLLDAPADGVDLCWRVRLIGGRVRTVPQAVGTVEPPSSDSGRLALDRGRLRTVLKCHGWVALVPKVALLAVASLVEAVFAVLRGRFAMAYRLGVAWLWNLRHVGSLHAERKRVTATRVLRDGVVAKQQQSAAAWLITEARERLGAHAQPANQPEDQLAPLEGQPEGQFEGQFEGPPAAAHAASEPRGLASNGTFLVLAALLVVVVVFGSRHLITRGVGAFGQFALFAEPDELWAAYMSGWREVGMGVSGLGSFGLGLLGAASTLGLAATGLVRQVLVLGLIPVGLWGVWRLARPVAGPTASVGAVVLFGLNPLPYDALAQGRWDTLVIYASVSWLVLLVLRMSGVEHYQRHRASGFRTLRLAEAAEQPTTLVGRTGGLALLLIVVAAFEPLVLALVVLMSLVLALVLVSGVAARGGAGSWVALLGRTAGLPLIAVGIATLFHLNWFASGDGASGWLMRVINEPAVETTSSVTAALRLGVGQISDGLWGWGLVAAAVAALLLAAPPRLVWAQCGVALAAVAVAGIWVLSRGWLDGLFGFAVAARPAADLLVCVVLLGCCWTVAAGTSHFRWPHDERRRRVASQVSGVAPRARAAKRAQRMVFAFLVGAAVASVVPVLGASRDGGWNSSEFDLTQSLRLIDDGDVGPGYRVLWVGQPEVLPAAAWALDEFTAGAVDFGGTHVATSVGGYPDVRSSWAPPPTGATQRLIDAVRVGLSGQTLRMGRLLASFNVRYVIVTERSAPSFAAGYDREVPETLHDALSSQIDLRPIAADPAVRLFRNEAWWPTRAQFDSPLPDDFALDPIDLVVSDLSDGVGVLTDRQSPRSYSGSLGRGQLLVTEQHDEGWELTTTAGLVTPDEALGWAMSYQVPTDGPATLSYERSSGDTVELWTQLIFLAALIWLAYDMPLPTYGRRSEIKRNEQRT